MMDNGFIRMSIEKHMVVFLLFILSFASAQANEIELIFDKEAYNYGDVATITYKIPDLGGDPSISIKVFDQLIFAKNNQTGTIKLDLTIKPNNKAYFNLITPAVGHIQINAKAVWILGVQMRDWSKSVPFYRRHIGQIVNGVQSSYVLGSTIKATIPNFDQLTTEYFGSDSCGLQLLRLGRIYPGGARKLHEFASALVTKIGQNTFEINPDWTQYAAKGDHESLNFTKLTASISPHQLRLVCGQLLMWSQDIQFTLPKGIMIKTPYDESAVEYDDSAFTNAFSNEFKVSEPEFIDMSSPELPPLAIDYLNTLPSIALPELPNNTLGESLELPSDPGALTLTKEELAIENRERFSLAEEPIIENENNIRGEKNNGSENDQFDADTAENFRLKKLHAKYPGLNFFIEYPLDFDRLLKKKTIINVYKIINSGQRIPYGRYRMSSFYNQKEVTEAKTCKDEFCLPLDSALDIISCGNNCLRTRILGYTYPPPGEYEIRVMLQNERKDDGGILLAKRRLMLKEEHTAYQTKQNLSLFEKTFSRASVEPYDIQLLTAEPLLPATALQFNVKPKSQLSSDEIPITLQAVIFNTQEFSYNCQELSPIMLNEMQTLNSNGQIVNFRVPVEPGRYEMRLYTNSNEEAYPIHRNFPNAELLQSFSFEVESPGYMANIMNRQTRFMIDKELVFVEPKVNFPDKQKIQGSNGLTPYPYIFRISNLGQILPGGVRELETYQGHSSISLQNKANGTGQELSIEYASQQIDLGRYSKNLFHQFRLEDQYGFIHDTKDIFIQYINNNNLATVEYEHPRDGDWILDNDPVSGVDAWLPRIQSCEPPVPLEEPELEFIEYQFSKSVLKYSPKEFTNLESDIKDFEALDNGSFKSIESIHFGHTFYLQAKFTQRQPSKIYVATLGNTELIYMKQLTTDPLLYRSEALILTHEGISQLNN